MHPFALKYAQKDELQIFEAVDLIAYSQHDSQSVIDPTILGKWRLTLLEAIDSGELPAHSKALHTPYEITRPWSPQLRELAHRWGPAIVRREDFHEFCKKLGIPSPFPPTPKKGTTALERQFAALDQWLAIHDGQTLLSMTRGDRLRALKRLEPFREHKDSTIDTFWKRHGKARATAAAKGRGTK